MLFDPSKSKPIIEFKTPDDLGLSQKQYDALLATLAYLEDGKIEWVDYQRLNVGGFWCPSSLKTARFNMHAWDVSYDECGTICCIGGTACLLANDSELFAHYDDKIPGIIHLFNPLELREAWDAKPAQAAMALRNYLTTGKAKWSEVMRKKKAA